MDNNLKSCLSGLTKISSGLIAETNILSGQIQDIIKGSPLIDPGEYSAFEVTAIDTKKTQKISLIIDGPSIGATSGDIGDLYDVYIDWGDGSITSGKPQMVTTTFTGDNQCMWKNQSVVYYGYTFTTDRYDVQYIHTYASNGTYKIKIMGTTYYHFRCNTEETNIITRCLQKDLPLYRGLTRMQGTFAKSVHLTRIECPYNYYWPTNMIDMYGFFSDCPNLQYVGDMTLPDSTVRSTKYFFYNCYKLQRGIYIPDSVLNASQMYRQCHQLKYAPNTGNNNRDITLMFDRCYNLLAIDGQISQKTKYGSTAFRQTYKLINAPKFASGITWGAQDTQTQDWKHGTSYNKNSVIQNMFNHSGIHTAPLNLGTIAYTDGDVIDGSYLFDGCVNMNALPKLPNGINKCECVFRDCYSAVTCIAQDSYTSEYDLTTFLPSTVNNLGWAFNDCKSLINAPQIPTGVTSMNGCFLGCTSLTEITPFKADVDYPYLSGLIRTFADCSNLKVINNDFPSGLITLQGCFRNNYSLNQISKTFMNKLSKLVNMDETFTNCYSLYELYGSIPNTVESAHHTFAYCKALTTAPAFSKNSVCTNMAMMYYDCINLQDCNILIPKGVTNLDNCFNYCRHVSVNISNIIPDQFTSTSAISVDALFNNCKSIYGSEAEVEAIGQKLWNSGKTFSGTSTVFTGCDDSIRIYIPTSWGGLKENN